MLRSIIFTIGVLLYSTAILYPSAIQAGNNKPPKGSQAYHQKKAAKAERKAMNTITQAIK